MNALNELIKKIYAASLDPSIWWRVAEDVATLTRSNRIWLFGQGPDFVPTAGHLPKIPINELIDFIAEAGPDTDRASGRKKVPEGALFVAEKFYWVPFERNSSARVLIPRADHHRLLALALSRESREGCDVVRAELDGASHFHHPVQLISELSCHLLSSYDIACTLAKNQVFLGSSGRPNSGRHAVFLLGSNGKMLFASAAAHDLLRSPDSGLHLEGGVLKPVEISSPDVAVSHAARNGESQNPLPMSAALKVSREPGTLPLFVLLFALGRDYSLQDAATPRTILVVCDPELRTPHIIALLRQTWPLTAAEAKVAAQIFLGRGIDEVGAKLGVTRETVRTHLKRTFAKTGTSNQAELVAFIAAIQSIYFPF